MNTIPVDGDVTCIDYGDDFAAVEYCRTPSPPARRRYSSPVHRYYSPSSSPSFSTPAPHYECADFECDVLYDGGDCCDDLFFPSAPIPAPPASFPSLSTPSSSSSHRSESNNKKTKKEKTVATPQDEMDTLLKLQDFDGSWDLSQTFAFVCLSSSLTLTSSLLSPLLFPVTPIPSHVLSHFWYSIYVY